MLISSESPNVTRVLMTHCSPARGHLVAIYVQIRPALHAGTRLLCYGHPCQMSRNEGRNYTAIDINRMKSRLRPPTPTDRILQKYILMLQYINITCIRQPRNRKAFEIVLNVAIYSVILHSSTLQLSIIFFTWGGGEANTNPGRHSSIEKSSFQQ